MTVAQRRSPSSRRTMIRDRTNNQTNPSVSSTTRVTPDSERIRPDIGRQQREDDPAQDAHRDGRKRPDAEDLRQRILLTAPGGVGRTPRIRVHLLPFQTPICRRSQV